MSVVRRFAPFVPLVVLVVALAAAGCGKTTPMSSPMSPSSAGVGAVPMSGASITGTIVPARLNLTVGVAGSSVSTTADASGRFQLSAVPAGNVSLHVSAPGFNTTAPVGSVSDQERLSVTVQMSGASATVEVDERVEADDEAEVEGTIATVDTTAKTFTVGTATVQVTSTTTIRSEESTLTFADLKAGERVEVEGTLQGTVVSAQKIDVQGVMPTPANGTVERSGKVASLTAGTSCSAGNLSFKLTDGTLVTTSSTTTFGEENASCPSIAVGANVEVKGTLTGTTLAATRVTVDESD